MFHSFIHSFRMQNDNNNNNSVHFAHVYCGLIFSRFEKKKQIFFSLKLKITTRRRDKEKKERVQLRITRILTDG